MTIGTIDIVRFRDARDVIPRPARLTLAELVGLVANPDPPIRAELAAEIKKRLRTVDEAVAVLGSGQAPPGWLAHDPSFRKLERAVWTANGDPAMALATAADTARREAVATIKGRLPCWAPAVYATRATRGNAGVVSVTCATLDYEDGTSIDEALAPWWGAPALVHTTWRHTVDAPRFRVTLPLGGPVPAAAWPVAFKWITSRSAGTPDMQCSDAARIYAEPAIPARGGAYDHRAVGLDSSPLVVPVDALQPAPATPGAPGRPLPGGRPPATPRKKLARDALRSSREQRVAAARYLGARTTDRRADRIRCPRCGDQSVWFWLDPGSKSTAECHHVKTCAWWGHLDELLDAHGGARD